MTADSPTGEWIRSKGQSIGIRVTGWAYSAFILLFALGVASSKVWSPGGRVAMFGLVLVNMPVIWLTFRASNAGCRIEEGGLRIRSVLSNRLVPWAEIRSISLGRIGIYPYIGRVHLRDGGIVPIWGIQAPNIAPNNARTAALIDRLNREVDTRSTDAST